MCDDVGNSASNKGARACGSPVSRSTARLVAAQARAKKVKSASSSQTPPLPAPMLAKLATAWTTHHKFGLLVAELTLQPEPEWRAMANFVQSVARAPGENRLGW
jgi:hypothetical protein